MDSHQLLRTSELLEVLRRAGYRVSMAGDAVMVVPVNDGLFTLVRDLMENHEGLPELLAVEDLVEAIRRRAMNGEDHGQESV